MDQAIGILGQVILVLVAFACVLGLVWGVLVEVQAIARIIRKLKEHAVIPEPYVVQSANGKVHDPKREALGS
jgi:hypothetical protein